MSFHVPERLRVLNGPLGTDNRFGNNGLFILPPLPEPHAYQCYWRGDNDSTSWDQWHDASDPMPDKWDGEPPDEVTPHYTREQMRAYAAAAVAAAVPPGWKAVPVEPTEAMIDATHYGQPLDDIWRDMLAAAPEVPR